MKILTVINSLGSGGAEKLVSDYLKNENNNYDNEHYLYILSSKNNVHFDSVLELNSTSLVSKRNSLYNPLHLYDLIKLIKKVNPDVVHAHLFPSLYYVSIVSLFSSKTKFVFTEHNTTNRRMQLRFLKPIEKILYNRYHKIIAISEAVKKSLSKWINADSKIIVIPNGINLNQFITAQGFDLRAELSLNSSTKLVVMVARFNKQKDHDSVIRALSLLPENFYLILVGTGNRKNELKEKVSKMNLEDRVFFLGYRTDVSEIYKSSDIAVLYSHYEGFGISALEAIATKTPLVISDSPGLRDIVGSFEGVKTAQSYDELAQFILELSKNNPPNSLSNESKLKKYKIENYSESLKKLYIEIVNGKF